MIKDLEPVIDDLLDAVYEHRPEPEIIEKLVKVGNAVFEVNYPYVVVHED